jgi:hypothetical protein
MNSLPDSFQRRGLRKAARLLGGEPQLRAFLQVPAGELFCWMRGRAAVPPAVFIRIVEFLAAREVA